MTPWLEAAEGTNVALGLSFAPAERGKHYATGYRDNGGAVAGGRLSFPPLVSKSRI